MTFPENTRCTVSADFVIHPAINILESLAFVTEDLGFADDLAVSAAAQHCAQVRLHPDHVEPAAHFSAPSGFFGQELGTGQIDESHGPRSQQQVFFLGVGFVHITKVLLHVLNGKQVRSYAAEFIRRA